MKKCDICQGFGYFTIVRKIVPVAGFSLHPIAERVETEREKCPKCDGKGMVKIDEIHPA